MTWARLDDTFAQHPKIVGLSDAAFRLHVAAICYSNANLLDGKIHRSVLAMLTQRPRAAAHRRAEELVAATVWARADCGCYLIHDYLDYQPSRQQVEQERANKQAAGRAGGQAAAKARAVAKSKPVPVPGPVPKIPTQSKFPPNPPASRGERASRAKDGSKRKRDVIALREEQSTLSLEERYLGKHATKARTA